MAEEEKIMETAILSITKFSLDHAEDALHDFKKHMERCDLYKALVSHGDLVHYLDLGKIRAHDLKKVNPPKGEELYQKLEAVKKELQEAVKTIPLKCEFRLKTKEEEPFRYVKEPPKD